MTKDLDLDGFGLMNPRKKQQSKRIGKTSDTTSVKASSSNRSSKSRTYLTTPVGRINSQLGNLKIEDYGFQRSPEQSQILLQNFPESNQTPVCPRQSSLIDNEAENITIGMNRTAVKNDTLLDFDKSLSDGSGQQSGRDKIPVEKKKSDDGMSSILIEYYGDRKRGKQIADSHQNAVAW